MEELLIVVYLASHIRKMHKELATLHSSVSKPEFSNAIMSSSEDKPNEDEEKEEESNDDDERSGQVVADINQEEEKAAAEELKEAEQIV